MSRAQEELGSDADQSALDQRLVGFIRENQDLFEQLRAAETRTVEYEEEECGIEAG